MSTTVAANVSRPGFVDRYFGIAKAGSSIPRELRAGLTTFLGSEQDVSDAAAGTRPAIGGAQQCGGEAEARTLLGALRFKKCVSSSP